MSSLQGSLHRWCCFSQFLGLSFCFSFAKNLTLKCLWKGGLASGEISSVAQLSEVTGQTNPLPRMCSWPGSPPHPGSGEQGTASLTRLTGLRRRLGYGLSDSAHRCVCSAQPGRGLCHRPDGRLCPSTSDHLGYNAFVLTVSPFTPDFKTDD